MIVNLLNLPPNTPHGFHIHEFGDTFSQGKLVTVLFLKVINFQLFLMLSIYRSCKQMMR